MRNGFYFLIVLLLGFEAWSQQVKPLFRNDSFVTQVSIPFALRDNSQRPLEITNLEITSDGGNCLGLIDRFIRSNFFVKCNLPDVVRASLYFSQNGQIYKINYGPFSVTPISDGTVVTPTTPTTPTTPDTTQGRQLFQSKCISCHTAYEKPNRTFTQIKSALTNISSMRTIQITDDQIRAISTYLSNL